VNTTGVKKCNISIKIKRLSKKTLSSLFMKLSEILEVQKELLIYYKNSKM
jgi:hypothetical protein